MNKKTIFVIACIIGNLVGYGVMVAIGWRAGPTKRFLNGVDLLAFAIAIAIAVKYSVPEVFTRLLKGAAALYIVLAAINVFITAIEGNWFGLCVSGAYLLGSSLTYYFTSKRKEYLAK